MIYSVFSLCILSNVTALLSADWMQLAACGRDMDRDSDQIVKGLLIMNCISMSMNWKEYNTQQLFDEIIDGKDKPRLPAKGLVVYLQSMEERELETRWKWLKPLFRKWV